MNNEIAKEGVKQLAEKASHFLGKLVEQPLEELGGLLTDQVKLWRFKNQVNIILKAEKYLKDKNIEPRKIPLKTLVPLLEQSSWEENPDMQNRWASLLASSADPNYNSHIHSSYVEILKQLSPIEAKLLDIMYSEYKKSSEETKNALKFAKEKICPILKMQSEQFDVMVANLYRLNLLQPPASYGGVSIGKYPIVLRTFDVVQLTALACDFITYCKYGN